MATTDTQDGASDASLWPAVERLLRTGRVTVDVLPADAQAAQRVCSALGLDDTSVLGSLVRSTGGVLIDHGWVRLLGSGAQGLDDVSTATTALERAGHVAACPASGHGGSAVGFAARGATVVAYDVLGGRFAVNGGALPGRVGEVCYWGPDTLEWSALGRGFDSFPMWLVGGALNRFYVDLRWPGWQDEVAAVPPGEGIVCYPFLFSAEGRDPGECLRVHAPLSELLDVHDDLARQVAHLEP